MKLKIITHTEIYDLEKAFEEWEKHSNVEIMDLIFSHAIDLEGTPHFTVCIFYEENVGGKKSY